MKTLHLESERYNQTSLNKLESFTSVDYGQDYDQHRLLEHLKVTGDYEVLFVKLGVHIDAQVFSLLPKLRYIVTPTTGLTHIDTGQAEQNGVTVVSLKGETEFLKQIRSTAEHTWALLLALCRNIVPAHYDITHEGNWRRNPFLCTELDGKTIGIIGYGRLGKIVAGYANAFGMKVLVTDADSQAVQHSLYENTPLEVVLQTADIISLHIPANEQNIKFISEEHFSMMKEGVLFINTARGEVVDEDALLFALESGKVAGAALDVLDGDSSWDGLLPSDNALFKYAREHSNVLLTPHIGGYGRESIERTRDFIVDKFLGIVNK
ncbi:NAD(P)-dependent oxidoreductase [Rufibacter quisquiliarum]|uniref:D-3-phosphoglycerate dehydrogenase n=1 Tax=Rufibacter quisquiliarum TaxID=1549639 RepID=A0A839GQ18_9BACT|nr:NAD(P)-dependent oxidoreductase [Rufibacter quisquiliarum]MBA9076976.1 D-3-phosphoglycerate dehydrogenase [Rufibacter quisquiliarum]